MALKIPIQASLSSASQQKGRTGCGDLGALHTAVRQALLTFCSSNQAGTARLQRWPAFLGRRSASASGSSLLLLLALQTVCVYMPVSCGGATGAKGGTAGLSSYPQPRSGARLSPGSSRWMRKQERCPNSSSILEQLVALGRTSRWVPALGPGLWGFHPDFRQEAGAGGPGMIRATEDLGLVT